MQKTNWKSFIRSLASDDAPTLTNAHWSIQQLEHIPSKSSFTHSAPPHMESRVAVNMRRPPYEASFAMSNCVFPKTMKLNCPPSSPSKTKYLVCKSFSICPAMSPCLKIFRCQIEVPPLHSVAVFPSLSFGTVVKTRWSTSMKDGVLKKKSMASFVLVGEQFIFRKHTCNKRVFGRIPWSKNLHLGRLASTKHWINFDSLNFHEILVHIWVVKTIGLHFPSLNYPFQKEQTSPSLGQNTPYNQRLSTLTKLHVKLSSPFYSKWRYQQRSTFQMVFPVTLLRPQTNIHQTSWLVGRRYSYIDCSGIWKYVLTKYVISTRSCNNKKINGKLISVPHLVMRIMLCR